MFHLVNGVHRELVDAGEGPLVEWKVQVLILIELIFLNGFIYELGWPDSPPRIHAVNLRLPPAQVR